MWCGTVFAAGADPTLGMTGFWPQGFESFCQEKPSECLPRKVADPVNLLQWESTLQDINHSVNVSIKYLKDPVDADHFDDHPVFGDCDDYALTKRNILISRGFDPSNLLFVFVFLHNLKQYHTTLVVRTNYGLKVMDNMFDEPYDLDRLVVDWAWLQSPENPKVWLPVD